MAQKKSAMNTDQRHVMSHHHLMHTSLILSRVCISTQAAHQEAGGPEEERQKH